MGCKSQDSIRDMASTHVDQRAWRTAQADLAVAQPIFEVGISAFNNFCFRRCLGLKWFNPTSKPSANISLKLNLTFDRAITPSYSFIRPQIWSMMSINSSEVSDPDKMSSKYGLAPSMPFNIIQITLLKYTGMSLCPIGSLSMKRKYPWGVEIDYNRGKLLYEHSNRGTYD